MILYYQSLLTFSTKAKADSIAKSVSNNSKEYHSSFKVSNGYKFDNRFDPRVTGVPNALL